MSVYGYTTVTVTATTYPTTPNISAAANSTLATSGRWCIYNPSAVVVVVSMDGVSDHFGIPPGWAWNDPGIVMPSRIYARLESAGSSAVIANFVGRAATIG